MTYEFAGSYPGQRVRLTFERCAFADPGYVLVFAFYQGKLLLTRHQKRGWEVPGGTREQGEFPVWTAIREVYEETGAELCAIEPVGQYVIESGDGAAMVKTIYIADVAQLHPLPDGFETEEIRLAEQPPTPEEVQNGAEYSLILKDDVYRLALDVILEHRFAKQA